MPRMIAVIPARHASTRFPGKPLALISGKPMIEQVWRRCQEAQTFDEVIVATDDARIVEVVRSFGGKVELTSARALSGTDRVAEVAGNRPGTDDDVLVNVQGDEPAIHPEALATLARVFSDPSLKMATLVRPLDEAERANPSVVKVVRDAKGFALYFSRADVPFARNPSAVVQRWAHLGIYGYRRKTLLALAALAPTALEQAESLEQLRALGHGVRIFCCETTHRGQAVDAAGDVVLAEVALGQLTKG